jgi:hypothetical protein
LPNGVSALSFYARTATCISMCVLRKGGEGARHATVSDVGSRGEGVEMRINGQGEGDVLGKVSWRGCRDEIRDG